jgi:hypothetical protein
MRVQDDYMKWNGCRTQSLKCHASLCSMKQHVYDDDIPPRTLLPSPSLALPLSKLLTVLAPVPDPSLSHRRVCLQNAQVAIREGLVRIHRAETILRISAQALLIVIHQLVRWSEHRRVRVECQRRIWVRVGHATERGEALVVQIAKGDA